MRELIDPGKRRRFSSECVYKREEQGAGGLNDHTFTGVGHRARNTEAGGELKNEGPKPYALDSAPDENFDPVF